MRKLMILALAVCLAVFPYMAAGEAAETREISLRDIRYYFEHRMLPQQFYQSPETVISYLESNGIYSLWSGFTGENNFSVTYGEEEFSVRDIPQENGMKMLMITMPEPEETPLCCRIYLCYDPEKQAGAYFTVEYDNNFDDSYFLCAWTPEGTHMNYGYAAKLDSDDPGFEDRLAEEAASVTALAGDVTAGVAADEPETEAEDTL